MKLTKEGLALLSGMVKSCMARRAEKFNQEQLELSANPQQLSLEKFKRVFPLETETSQRLTVFAQKLGKELIDEEVVARFFGGEEHIAYAISDLEEQGIKGEMAKLLLIFHLLLPVEIRKDKKKLLSGVYANQEQELVLRDIQALSPEIAVGQRVLVHYGYIICRCTKKLHQTILEEQSANAVFREACSRLGSIDCGKLLSAFHLLKK